MQLNIIQSINFYQGLALHFKAVRKEQHLCQNQIKILTSNKGITKINQGRISEIENGKSHTNNQCVITNHELILLSEAYQTTPAKLFWDHQGTNKLLESLITETNPQIKSALAQAVKINLSRLSTNRTLINCWTHHLGNYLSSYHFKKIVEKTKSDLLVK